MLQWFAANQLILIVFFLRDYLKFKEKSILFHSAHISQQLPLFPTALNFSFEFTALATFVIPLPSPSHVQNPALTS